MPGNLEGTLPSFSSLNDFLQHIASFLLTLLLFCHIISILFASISDLSSICYLSSLILFMLTFFSVSFWLCSVSLFVAPQKLRSACLMLAIQKQLFFTLSFFSFHTLCIHAILRFIMLSHTASLISLNLQHLVVSALKLIPSSTPQPNLCSTRHFFLFYNLFDMLDQHQNYLIYLWIYGLSISSLKMLALHSMSAVLFLTFSWQ